MNESYIKALGIKKLSVSVFILLMFFVPVRAESDYVHPSKTQRIKLFEDIKSKILEHHIFSKITEKNLSFDWREHIDEYKKWFSDAINEKELLQALNKFQNSLHNSHCRFRPVNRTTRKTLGFDVEYEKVDGKSFFYVSKIHSEKNTLNLIVGDYIENIDGIFVNDFTKRFFYVSAANNFFHLNKNIARYISNRKETVCEMPVKSKVILRSRKTGEIYERYLEWHEKSGNKDDSEFQINYSSGGCYDLIKRNYGQNYKLLHKQNNFCIYGSKDKLYKNYPIIRQFSFSYKDNRNLLHDFEFLKAYLESKKTKGFILDLRDNRGGNNPNWFIEWFTNIPYYDRFVKMKLSSFIAKPKNFSKIMMGGKKTDWYKEQLKKYGENKLSDFRPFFCRSNTCQWDNYYKPRKLMKFVPFAILSGFKCHSSCDSIVYNFSVNNIAPILGERGNGGYTSHRLPINIINPANKVKLGTFSLAISMDYDGESKSPIEGFAPSPNKEVMMTYENRAIYDKNLVKSAIEEIKIFPYKDK